MDQIEERIAMGATRHEASAMPARRSLARRSLRGLLLLPLIFGLVSVSQVLALRFVDPPLSAMMLERQVGGWVSGEWSFRIAYRWRDSAQIAPSLPISLVAAEDQRFPHHHGFDLEAIEKARDHNARGGRLRGASTISQQVAKNLFLWSGRSWLRKGLEAWYTVLIEALWSKQRILEVYVNVAEFGDGVYGAQAAASRFWGKDAAQLTPTQSALLAAVLPAPQRYDAARPGAYVQRRADWIERQARQLGGPAYLLQAP